MTGNPLTIDSTMHRGAAMEKQWNSHREASEEAKHAYLSLISSLQTTRKQFDRPV